MLEAPIEKAVCSYAKDKGWLPYKFSSPNKRSVPDRIFINRNGFILFIEFKATGKQPTPAQNREFIRLTKQGCEVLVIDDIIKGKRMIDRYDNTGMVYYDD